MALIGNDFTAYVAPTQAELDAQVAEDIRNERDQKLLTEVDPTVSNPLRWADMDSAKQAEWRKYRTDLLNVSQQAGFPHEVEWSEAPS